MEAGNDMKYLRYLFFIIFINMGISFGNDFQGIWVCNWFDLQKTSTKLYSWGEDICVKDDSSFYIDNYYGENIFSFSNFGICSYNCQNLQDKTLFEIYDKNRGIQETLIFILISDYEMYISDESTCGFLPKGKNNRYFRISGPNNFPSLQLPLTSEVTKKTELFWGDTVIGVIYPHKQITIVGVDNRYTFDSNMSEQSIFIKIKRNDVNNLETSFYTNMGLEIPDIIIGTVRRDVLKMNNQKIK